VHFKASSLPTTHFTATALFTHCNYLSLLFFLVTGMNGIYFQIVKQQIQGERQPTLRDRNNIEFYIQREENFKYF
jgi:hypothetical protein